MFGILDLDNRRIKKDDIKTGKKRNLQKSEVLELADGEAISAKWPKKVNGKQYDYPARVMPTMILQNRDRSNEGILKFRSFAKSEFLVKIEIFVKNRNFD